MATASQLRIQRDLQQLSLPEDVSVEYDANSDPYLVTCRILPFEGPYHPATLTFTIKFPPTYPYSPPRVHTPHRLFHPNISPPTTANGGNAFAVCLNILRLDWSPALDLQCVILGLLGLLLEPQGEDALNGMAGRLIEEQWGQFTQVVQRTLKGGIHDGIAYDRLLPE